MTLWYLDKFSFLAVHDFPDSIAIVTPNRLTHALLITVSPPITPKRQGQCKETRLFHDAT
jgi:hypothetical protein